MSANRYDELLREASGSEPFVRRSLAHLESDFRALALLALSDWERTGVVSSDLFPALAGLQRLAWGTWNGLLAALRSARREALRTGSAAERQKVEQAAILVHALQLLDERLDAAVAESVKLLCEVTRWRGKLTTGNALSMAIGVRNMVAHDPPTDEAGWGRLAEALRPLVQLHARRSLLESLGESVEYRPPWFESEGATLWTFNGLEEDFSARYVAEGREESLCGLRVPSEHVLLWSAPVRVGERLHPGSLEALRVLHHRWRVSERQTRADFAVDQPWVLQDLLRVLVPSETPFVVPGEKESRLRKMFLDAVDEADIIVVAWRVVRAMRLNSVTPNSLGNSAMAA